MHIIRHVVGIEIKTYFGPEPGRRMEMKSQMNGFVKFVLLTFMMVFIVAMVMSIMLFTYPRKAHAENGISPEIATYKLFIGETTETIIPDNIGKTSILFVFPLFKERTDYSDTRVSYRNGKWLASPATPRFTERSNDMLNYFMFLLALGTVVVFTASFLTMWRKLTGTVQVLSNWANL